MHEGNLLTLHPQHFLTCVTEWCEKMDVLNTLGV